MFGGVYLKFCAATEFTEILNSASDLGWGQIDEHCWSNNVGRQKLNHLTSHLNNVETCVTNMIIQNLYFGFCQTFQPNEFVRDDVLPD